MKFITFQEEVIHGPDQVPPPRHTTYTSRARASGPSPPPRHIRQPCPTCSSPG
jgi:hypothetical protein